MSSNQNDDTSAQLRYSNAERARLLHRQSVVGAIPQQQQHYNYAATEINGEGAEASAMLTLLSCDERQQLDFDDESHVARFYANRAVFVTGASGFVGKVLVEKLLRSCKQLSAIYVLMRPKFGKSPAERISDLTSSEIFHRLKQQQQQGNENVLDKIKLVGGDVTQPNFGISQSDVDELCANVSIIIHSAATVKFNEPMKSAIENNLLSMQNLLSLARQMPRLDALVHVSTAYSNCDRQQVAEQLYEPPIDARKLLQLDELLDMQTLDAMTPSLLGKRPNTYTYTKACAESLLAEFCARDERLRNVPVVVVRPSIVAGSWREPLRGWVDNLNGPTGVVLAVMTGALQALNINSSMKADIIPVDIVANLIICSAWHCATTQNKQKTISPPQQIQQIQPNNSTTTTTTPTTTSNVTVFNCVSGHSNPITWQRFSSIIYKTGIAFPCTNVLRFPRSYLIGNTSLYKLVDFFNHKLVAHAGDFVCKLVGKKQRLVALYGKTDKMVETLRPFVLNQWQFESSNVANLHQQLSPVDKRIFNFNVAELNWDDYIKRYYIGCKLFVLNDKPADICNAQVKMRDLQRGANLALLLVLLLTYYFVLLGSELEDAALSMLLGLVGQFWPTAAAHKPATTASFNGAEASRYEFGAGNKCNASRSFGFLAPTASLEPTTSVLSLAALAASTAVSGGSAAVGGDQL